ncbi:MAG: DivIVA domain-containing protein [Oscillospiraceae bacterium]|nr:DivIVA domain-containing protein [Oscillospiraceae bacterium]
MATTREFLDGIEFDTVKQKYYNANKVNACLDELIAGARELLEENERLKSANAEVEAARAEIGDTLLSAKQIAAAIVREANEEAQRVLDDANEEANRLLISAEEQRCMTKSPLSESQLKAIEAFNAQLDALNVSQATQIFRLKQAILKIAADEA